MRTKSPAQNDLPPLVGQASRLSLRPSPSHSVRGSNRRRNARPFAGGFSLLEILIVLAIMGLLAALVASRLTGTFGQGQVKATRVQLQSLSTSVERFRTDVQRYPTEQEGLQSLIVKPLDADGWAGPYLDKSIVPKDAWKRDFLYRLDPTFGFRIVSLGADGKEGGEGENADLDNRS